MKIKTDFDRRLEEIYSIIGLSYPPRPSCDLDGIELEENIVEIKPFPARRFDRETNKDMLITVHKATKQLVRHIGEGPLYKRDQEVVLGMRDPTQVQHRNELVGSLNQMNEILKSEKIRRDTEIIEKSRSALGNALRGIQRFAADQREDEEKVRRISQCHDAHSQQATMRILTQLAPIHEQLTTSYARANGSTEELLRQISSRDFDDCDSEISVSGGRLVAVNAKMKAIFNSAEMPEEERLLETAGIVKGAGKIGRTLKKTNKSFQSKISDTVQYAKKKSVVQNELLKSLVTKERNAQAGSDSNIAQNFGKLNLAIETAARKAEGKMVEKEQAKALKEAQWDDARRDTLGKIVYYGQRKEVLENIDTTYLTNVKHDARAETAKASVVRMIGGGTSDSKLRRSSFSQGRKPSLQPSRPAGTPGSAAGRRHSAGPPRS